MSSTKGASKKHVRSEGVGGGGVGEGLLKSKQKQTEGVFQA